MSIARHPLVAGLVGSLATMLVLSAEAPAVETVREVRVLQAVPDEELQRDVVTVTRVVERCDTEAAARLLNEVLRSRAKTGEAGTRNRAGGGDVSQVGSAKTGDAVIGQTLDVVAVCASVDLNAVNTVTDSTAITGDAEVRNTAHLGPEAPQPTAPATETSRPAPDWWQTPAPGWWER